MKIFIDTNIFLDLVLKRTYYKEAMVILNAVEKKIFDGVVLDITLLNIDYVAKKQIKDIRDFLKILNSAFTVIGASNENIKIALEMDNSDLEDNLQYISAEKSNVSLIITNDKNFYSAKIETISSADFVNKYL